MDREAAGKATLDVAKLIGLCLVAGGWIWLTKTYSWMPTVNVFLLIAAVIGGIWTIQYNEHNYKGDGGDGRWER